MTPINYFPSLGYTVLSSILKNVGGFSEFSSVCRVFKAVITSEAEDLHALLIKMFGDPCLNHVFKTLKLEDKSLAAKLDGLFHTSMQKEGCRAAIRYDENAMEKVKSYLYPVMQGQGLAKLWEALSEDKEHALSSEMSSITFQDSFLDNVKIIQEYFKRRLFALAQATHLDLGEVEMRVLPGEISLFKNLTVLDLSNNLLTALPKEIGCLSKLQTLKLDKNFLSHLPHEIVGLHSLEYLGLESNRFSVLPAAIGSISSLKGLYLYANQIAEIPDSFCDLNHLMYLSTQNNALTSLPESIGKMHCLESLFVDYNRIKKLPDSLCSLSELKNLSFSHNEIADLPSRINQLTKLQCFYFAGNPIKKFPISAQQLNFWSLDPALYPSFENGMIRHLLNRSLSEQNFNAFYWGFGKGKWMECIDGRHHAFGPFVYDEGLHGKDVEAGFLSSMYSAFLFLHNNCNQIVDADFYLQLHKIACSHFKGKKTCTLIESDRLGAFRGLEDNLFASFADPGYKDGAIEEIAKLDALISSLFGPSFRIGDIEHKLDGSFDLLYFPMSSQQVRIIFNYFLTEFYYDISHAGSDYLKIRAIAKVIQRLELLHPVPDGCGRTDTALLNYLPTVYGFNPVLLEDPYSSSSRGLNEWTSYLIQGLENWRKAANNC